MKLNPNGLIVAAAYALLLLLTMDAARTVSMHPRSASTIDLAVRAVFWAVLLLVTAATVTRMVRRRRLEPLGLDAALREMELWAAGIVQGLRRLHR